MNRYEEKRQARIDRLHDRARQASNESDALHEQAHKMASVIPFGEPIHVGHHSEGRDRRYRGRIQGKFEKAFETQKKADELAYRAAAAEDNTAISSDDPEAVTRLREKLADLEKFQTTMKSANKIVKRKSGTQEEKIVELEALEIKDAARLFVPDFVNRVGFPGYAITNNNATIRSTQKRIEQLLEASKQEDKEYMLGEIRVHENTEENRLQLFFPGKPSEEIRGLLKSSGFHWSPYNNAWQRQLNNAARWTLKSIEPKLHTEKL